MSELKTRKQCLIILEFSNTDNPSEKQIKSKFKKLSFKHHPDKGGDTKKYRDICDAYEALLENKFEPDKKQKVPDDIADRAVSKLSSFLDSCSDKINIKDKKIIFKLINNNIVCIKIETLEEKRIAISNYIIQLKKD